MSAEDAISIFNAGVDAVKPAILMPQYLQVHNNTLHAGSNQFLLDKLDGIYLLAVGKAASAMAEEVEKVLDPQIKTGLVVTKYHHALPLRYCDTIEAGHPVPDKNSVAAAITVKEFLKQLTPNSLLLCCISGGASALLGDIIDGITLADMQQVSTLLLKCGAGIQELNTVRKHLCYLKGGQLVRYTNGAAVTSFIISDVVGNNLSVIASGLTVADDSTYADARAVLEKYGLTARAPHAVSARLKAGRQNAVAETPKAGDAIFNKVHNNVIGTNNTALQAAALQAGTLGYEVHIINNSLSGEAGVEAKKFVELLLAYKGSKPTCLLMGGETTVTVKGSGKGGRNQQFTLAALCELQQQGIALKNMPVILSGGTDGTDGPTDAAGAYTDIDIFLTMRNLSLNARNYLQNNDAYHFFKQTGGLVLTGATQTNVMDIIIGLMG